MTSISLASLANNLAKVTVKVTAQHVRERRSILDVLMRLAYRSLGVSSHSSHSVED